MSVEKNVLAPSQRVESAELSSPFGPPPLIGGEDPSTYYDFLARICDAVKPKDFLEQIWIRDVADLVLEIQRMRYLKASLLSSALPQVLEQVLVNLMDEAQARELSTQWAAGDRRAIKKVDGLHTAMGKVMDLARARALSAHIFDVERIDRMLMNAEARRDAALHEIERHRSRFAEVLRQASVDVVDAQFEDA